MLCEICRKKKATKKLTDGKMKLSLCNKCLEVNYPNENIEWIES